MKLLWKLLRWGVAALALAAGIRFLPELRAVPFLLAALLLLPFPPFRCALEKLRLGGWRSTVLELLFLAVGLFPLLSSLSPAALPTRAVPIPAENAAAELPEAEHDFVLNTSSRKVHLPDCGSVADIADYNCQHYHGNYSQLETWGYSPCKRCHPEELT